MALGFRFPFSRIAGPTALSFSADVFETLAIQPSGSPAKLEGIGGQAASVIVATPIRFIRESGEYIVFNGEFAAFTDLKAIDMSVLGRDLTNLFALIVDRPQDVVCMLGAKHRYVIVES